MDALHEATDYRPWLRQALKDLRRRHPSRTSRALAEILDIDPAHLSRVLAGRKHIATRHVPELCKFLKLSRPDGRYLEALVRCNTATEPTEASRHFLAMQAMRGAYQRTLQDDAHDYFRSWIHPVMRTLLSLVEFRGLGWIRLASLFRRKVTPDQAQESVELLLRLGLLESDARGILRPSPGTVSSGENWLGQAVHEFQRQTLALSAELLETQPREERDISTLTLPSSRQRMDELRDKIRQFRQELMTWSR
ncbi:MAG: TIGR02147 family protein, partial [Fibrobacterota bacterium]